MRDAVDDYIRWAVEHGDATRAGRSRRVNRAYRRMMRALSAVERGRLVPLLEHDSPSVRCWAATHLLGHAPDAAVPVLEALAANDRTVVGFDAEMVLKEWRAGRLVVEQG